MIRSHLCLPLLLLAGASWAQTRVTEENYASFFKQAMQKQAYLYYPGDDREKGAAFLGNLTNSKYDSDGVATTYGDHGSKYGDKSIWSKYGTYGGTYGDKSPWNKYGRKGVEIRYKLGDQVYIVGVLSANKYLTGYTVPIVDPKYLAYWLDRAKDIP